MAWGLDRKTHIFIFEIGGNGACAAYLNFICDRPFTTGPIDPVLSYETGCNKGLFQVLNEHVLSSQSIARKQYG